MPIGVPRAAGYNSLPNGNFLPEIWSRKMQLRFYAKTVIGSLLNHDWEGEIKSGGTKVKIRVRPTVVVQDYPVGGNINYQDLDDDFIELSIDKAKLTAFKVDDIDVAQSDIPIMNETIIDAANRMKIAIDTEVLASIYTSATSQIATQQVTKSTVIDWILGAGTALDELNIPDANRFIILPPWITELIKSSDLKDASLSGDATSPLRNGRVGVIDRFNVHMSNNLAVTTGGTQWECLAGTRDFGTFASQYTKTETLRLQNTFGDGVRSLNVYGFGVTHPDSGVHLSATK
jgi:hypothetical protein